MNLEFSKELKSLLASCSNSFSETESSQSAFSMEWEKLLFLTKKHRISSLVYKNLTITFPNISEKFKAQIRLETKKSAFKMMSFTAEISTICNEFSNKSIPIIPLKGPIAAKQIYGDFLAKNSRDIDFLIQEESLEDAIKWLESRGYINIYSFNSLNKKQKKAFQKVNNQLAFIHPKKKIQLELHWRLFANSYLLPLSFDDLMKDICYVTVGKTPVCCLSKKHQLFYLCVHGAKHNWSLLYWLVEVAKLIQNEKFDWGNILQEAIQLGIERPLVQGIILIETLLKIESPHNIKDYYEQQRVIQKLVENSINAIRNEDHTISQKSISNYWQKLTYKIKLKKSLRYKLAYWNPISINDFELIKLPESLFFGYFWFRPIFLCWRYLLKPIKKA